MLIFIATYLKQIPTMIKIDKSCRYKNEIRDYPRSLDNALDTKPNRGVQI